ncbi:conjugal transfer protein TraI [Sphingomonas sp. R647]|uniref:TrbI/VirB10 family protein n=1 Tax=Sphingomonas sp. R647 TaxID=2875233 RepID=UPI001CD47A6F|nr:TrbI/VirB10 family protein [Sphingomonas sp. R647]MCA1200146.1 conjugal transfer protein TraI [Sphingomonas sp. R647]
MSEDQAAATLEPVDLRLRADPPQVMRLSRKALAIAGAGLASGIAGALIYALQPILPERPDELYADEDQAVRPGLAGAPIDYAQVPKLGPPLPGDLGRPILSAQQRGVEVSAPPIGDTSPPSTKSVPDAARTSRERAREERDTARTSRLFAAGSAVSSSPDAVTQPVASRLEPSLPPAGASRASQEIDRSARRSFLAAGAEVVAESNHRVIQPSSEFAVQAGSIIPAALITGIRSDLPGLITAQVTEPVYDSVTGRHLLIPQGSRLVGEYDAEISMGQNRVLLAWDRLILPDGRSIKLDRLPGADASGYAGLEDRVDHHWGGVFRAALVSSLLSVGAQVGNDDDDALVRALREGSSESIARTGQELVRRQMAVQPTLTIRPGTRLRVIVTRDLILEPNGGPA